MIKFRLKKYNEEETMLLLHFIDYVDSLPIERYVKQSFKKLFIQNQAYTIDLLLTYETYFEMCIKYAQNDNERMLKSYRLDKELTRKQLGVLLAFMNEETSSFDVIRLFEMIENKELNKILFVLN